MDDHFGAAKESKLVLCARISSAVKTRKPYAERPFRVARKMEIIGKVWYEETFDRDDVMGG